VGLGLCTVRELADSHIDDKRYARMAADCRMDVEVTGRATAGSDDSREGFLSERGFLAAEKSWPHSDNAVSREWTINEDLVYAGPLFLEYRLRDQSVDTFDAVDSLGYNQVHRRTEQHVGVLSRKTFCLDYEIKHLACSDFGCLI